MNNRCNKVDELIRMLEKDLDRIAETYTLFNWSTTNDVTLAEREQALYTNHIMNSDRRN